MSKLELWVIPSISDIRAQVANDNSESVAEYCRFIMGQVTEPLMCAKCNAPLTDMGEITVSTPSKNIRLAVLCCEVGCGYTEFYYRG